MPLLMHDLQWNDACAVVDQHGELLVVGLRDGGGINTMLQMPSPATCSPAVRS